MQEEIYTYLFRRLNTETGMLLTKYPGDKDTNTINRLNETFFLEVGEDDMGFINYLTLLIQFCEQKEDYEWCAKFLQLKESIKIIVPDK